MVLLVLSAGVAGLLAHGYWARLGDARWQRRFWSWFWQGLVFPVLAWGVANVGFGERFPALVPQIVDARAGNQPWFGLWFGWFVVGCIFIGIHWTSVTYVWLVTRVVEAAEDKRECGATLLVFGLFGSAVAGVMLYHAGWIYAGAAVSLAFLPMVHFTIDLAEKGSPRPSYSKAIGKLKFGKYSDAEWEVISQLEKSENDFEGWMILAELYAKQYRNMEDAARVVLEVCKSPETQPFQISMACHKLADWQLEVEENPAGARAALELLGRLAPGTHFARMAEQRLRQIPRSVEEFDESRKPKVIRLPVLREEAEEGPRVSAGPRSEAAAEANRLSEKLTENPNDIEARQKLAVVLAEKLGKVELAVEQLRLLIELPDPEPEAKAKWLARIASWEFHRDKDSEKFCAALREIIRDYPRTSQAFAAQRRLNLTEMNFSRAEG
jgi:hypothetical protein